MVNSIASAKQAETLAKVQFAAFRKVKQAQVQQGNAALKLLQAASQTGQKAGVNLYA